MRVHVTGEQHLLTSTMLIGPMSTDPIRVDKAYVDCLTWSGPGSTLNHAPRAISQASTHTEVWGPGLVKFESDVVC